MLQDVRQCKAASQEIVNTDELMASRVLCCVGARAGWQASRLFEWAAEEEVWWSTGLSTTSGLSTTKRPALWDGSIS